MMKVLAAILIIFSPQLVFAQAGSSGGNGGDAVQVGNIVDRVSNGFRLLDFHQVNLKDTDDKMLDIAITFQKSAEIDKVRLKRDLGKIVQELPIDFLKQQTLTGVIGSLDPLMARILAAPFAMYNWERKSNVTYVDDFQSPDDYQRGRSYQYNDGVWRAHNGVHQVGRRIDDKIEIADVIFTRMFEFDQLGLLIHEAFYSLLKKDESLPYGQNPELARQSVVEWFQFRMGLGTSDPLETQRFGFSKVLIKARSLLQADEALQIEFERGRYYRIQAQKFTLEFKFEFYQTQLFPTQYLTPKLILK